MNNHRQIRNERDAWQALADSRPSLSGLGPTTSPGARALATARAALLAQKRERSLMARIAARVRGVA